MGCALGGFGGLVLAKEREAGRRVLTGQRREGLAQKSPAQGVAGGRQV